MSDIKTTGPVSSNKNSDATAQVQAARKRLPAATGMMQKSIHPYNPKKKLPGR